MTPPVRVRELVHVHGRRPVLDVPSLDLGPGHVHLTGPNGAGKTTLLKILATLTTPTRGRIQIAGHPLPDEARQARARLGYAGHDPSLHGAFTPRSSLAMQARLHDLDDPPIEAILDEWNLAHAAEARVDELSYGQRARLDLARALLPEPDVLLLDEPTAGLDDASRERLAAAVDRADPALLVAASPGAAPLETETTLRLVDGQPTEAPP